MSPSGALVFKSGAGSLNQFAWVDRTGRALQTVGESGQFRTLALSPDGRRVAYEDRTRGDIMVLDLQRQTSSRFTSGPGLEECPVWFPDGSKIAYRVSGGGVFVKDAGGTSPERLLLNTFINGPSQVTADGKWLVFFWIASGG